MTTQPDVYQIRINDLPGEVREIARLIGLAPALKLVTEYSGEMVYIPKYEAITRALRNKAILAEATGKNYKELARKFNLTTRVIRTIIREEKRKNTQSGESNERTV